MFRVAPWTLALLIACGPPPSPNDPDPPPPPGLDAGVSIDAPGYVGPIRYELRLTGDRFDTRSDVSVVISEGGASYGCSKSYGPAAPCPPPPPPAEERFSLRPPAPGEVLTFTTALVEAGRPVRITVHASAGDTCNQVYGSAQVVAAAVTQVEVPMTASKMRCSGG